MIGMRNDVEHEQDASEVSGNEKEVMEVSGSEEGVLGVSGSKQEADQTQ